MDKPEKRASFRIVPSALVPDSLWADFREAIFENPEHLFWLRCGPSSPWDSAPGEDDWDSESRAVIAGGKVAGYVDLKWDRACNGIDEICICSNPRMNTAGDLVLQACRLLAVDRLKTVSFMRWSCTAGNPLEVAHREFFKYLTQNDREGSTYVVFGVHRLADGVARDCIKFQVRGDMYRGGKESK